MDQEDERATGRESEQDLTAARRSDAGRAGDVPPPADTGSGLRAADVVRPAGGAPGADRGGSGGATMAVGGFEFAAVLLASVFLGQWLDRRLGTAPVFLLVCVFVGFAGATFSMYRRLTAAQAREDEARRARNESSGK